MSVPFGFEVVATRRGFEYRDGSADDEVQVRCVECGESWWRVRLATGLSFAAGLALVDHRASHRH